MKSIIALLALVAVASALTDYEAWTHFRESYGKMYGTVMEESNRYKIFQQNLRNAEDMQVLNPSAIFGITQFMDLSPAEFEERYANLNTSSHKSWLASLPKSFKPTGPTSPVDWRGKAVTQVKDQGSCGSCWAFSAMAAMESCMMLKNGGTAVLGSDQQIVDCCVAGGSDGCNGGYPDQAVSWAISQNIATQATYPYTAKKATCKKVTTIAIPAGTCKFVSIAEDEVQLVSHLQDGPVSVCVAANSLQYYTGGIITACSDTAVNHAVFMTTYTGTAYAVKNSWGTSWGEAGYFRLTSGKNCLSITYLSSQALPK